MLEVTKQLDYAAKDGSYEKRKKRVSWFEEWVRYRKAKMELLLSLDVFAKLKAKERKLVIKNELTDFAEKIEGWWIF